MTTEAHSIATLRLLSRDGRDVLSVARDRRFVAFALSLCVILPVAPKQAGAEPIDAEISGERTARTKPPEITPPVLSPEALSPVPAPPHPHVHRVPAPSEPISSARAEREWDGTGELLLAPDDPLYPSSTFTIGATFDTTDDRKQLGQNDRSSDRICLEGTYWFDIARGTAGGIAGPNHSRYASNMSNASQGKVSGLAFTRADCRMTMRLRLKVPNEGGWVEAPEIETSPFPRVSTGGGPYLRSNESFILPTTPSPAEIQEDRDHHPWSIGSLAPETLADQCPRRFGMMTFDSNGMYIMMPWRSDPPLTPGVRRDPAMRTTTLIFQTKSCRVEIEVTREIKGEDGLWTRSPLSPIGPPNDH